MSSQKKPLGNFYRKRKANIEKQDQQQAKALSKFFRGASESTEAGTGPSDDGVFGLRSQNDTLGLQKNMSLEIYYFPASPPSRAVLLLVEALGIDPVLNIVNLLKGEQYSLEFMQINPQHTVPTIVDEDFIITESQAGLTYLAEVYDESKTLYPEDIEQRAIVNQMLYFNTGTLYQRVIGAYIMPVIFMNQRIDDENLTMLEDAFNTFNIYLEDQDWAAGSQMTVADYSLVASVSTAEGVGFPVSKYPNVAAWLDRCKTAMVGYNEINQKGVDMMSQVFHSKIQQSNS